MPQFLRAYAERAAESKPGDVMRFVASTENVARDGMVIPADAWQLDNFRKSPVFLWAHDYFSRPPIGRVTNVEVKDDQLLADVEFDQDDEFARQVESKYRKGILSAVSVGWDTLSYEPPNGPNVAPRVTKADLLDISAVPVPSDPDALKQRGKRAMAALGHELLALADEEIPDTNPKTPDPDPEPPTARASWPETAASMVRLFRPYVQGPDDERVTAYRRLAREYARHGKTPPEVLTVAEVDALSIDDIRGLFLEGEPDLLADTFAAMETRAGAVLSTRNQEDLQRASDLILGVLARAKKEAEQTDDERAAEAELRKLRAIFTGDQTE